LENKLQNKNNPLLSKYCCLENNCKIKIIGVHGINKLHFDEIIDVCLVLNQHA
jgi:hypothetical protein